MKQNLKLSYVAASQLLKGLVALVEKGGKTVRDPGHCWVGTPFCYKPQFASKAQNLPNLRKKVLRWHRPAMASHHSIRIRPKSLLQLQSAGIRRTQVFSDSFEGDTMVLSGPNSGIRLLLALFIFISQSALFIFKIASSQFIKGSVSVRFGGSVKF